MLLKAMAGSGNVLDALQIDVQGVGGAGGSKTRARTAMLPWLQLGTGGPRLLRPKCLFADTGFELSVYAGCAAVCPGRPAACTCVCGIWYACHVNRRDACISCRFLMLM